MGKPFETPSLFKSLLLTFIEDRQSGSHLILWHQQRQMSVTIPVHTGCDLGRGLAVRILKDAGFSVEDYLRLR